MKKLWKDFGTKEACTQRIIELEQKDPFHKRGYGEATPIKVFDASTLFFYWEGRPLRSLSNL